MARLQAIASGSEPLIAPKVSTAPEPEYERYDAPKYYVAPQTNY